MLLSLEYLTLFNNNNRYADVGGDLTILGESAFQDCHALEGIHIPHGVTVIEESTFEECHSLIYLTLPEKLTTLGESCFASTSLQQLRLPKTVTDIRMWAFWNCNYLETCTLLSSSVTFGVQPFFGCNPLIQLAEIAGFPSTNFQIAQDPQVVGAPPVNTGAGVVPYLLDQATQVERTERRRLVLLANLRFQKFVHNDAGASEVAKVANAKRTLHPPQDLYRYYERTTRGNNLNVAEFMNASLIGGGARGVLSSVLSFV